MQKKIRIPFSKKLKVSLMSNGKEIGHANFSSGFFNSQLELESYLKKVFKRSIKYSGSLVATVYWDFEYDLEGVKIKSNCKKIITL